MCDNKHCRCPDIVNFSERAMKMLPEKARGLCAQCLARMWDDADFRYDAALYAACEDIQKGGTDELAENVVASEQDPRTGLGYCTDSVVCGERDSQVPQQENPLDGGSTCEARLLSPVCVGL